MACGGASTPCADLPGSSAKPFRRRSKLQSNTPFCSLRWRWRLAVRTIWHRLPRVASWMRFSVGTLGNVPIPERGKEQIAPDDTEPLGKIRCQEWLGGVLKHYCRKAA